MKIIKIIEKIFKLFMKDIFPFNIIIWKHPFYKQIFFRYKKYFSQYYNFEEIINYQNKFNIIVSWKRWSIDMWIILFWKYEDEISELMLKEISNIDIFIDIWWNIWFYTLFISSQKNIPIYTFEPINETFDILKRNIKLNNFKNIILYNLALWSKKDSFEINLKEELWHNSLISNNNKFSSKKQIINIDKWDNIFRDIILINKNILIKIDVEWFEFESIKWLKETIKNNNCKIFLEYTPIFFKNITDNINNYSINFLNTFFDLGYKIYDIEDNLKEIINIEIFVNNFNKVQTNLLILK